MTMDTGIAADARGALAEGLKRLLADSYVLYLKTHGFHWNVTGPYFFTLHTAFETQYTELAAAVDVIAERIRALGVLAPGSWQAFEALSRIPETPDVPEARQMVRLLVDGHETVARTARELIPVADEAGDQVTADLITQRITVHEKTAWMLRAFLAE